MKTFLINSYFYHIQRDSVHTPTRPCIETDYTLSIFFTENSASHATPKIENWIKPSTKFSPVHKVKQSDKFKPQRSQEGTSNKYIKNRQFEYDERVNIYIWEGTRIRWKGVFTREWEAVKELFEKFNTKKNKTPR